jgi:hypothetical protein
MAKDTSKRVTREQALEYLQREDDSVLATMLRHDMALTRDAYIFANWGHKPEPLTAEEEEQVPDIFREGAMERPPKPVRDTSNSSGTTRREIKVDPDGIVRSKHTRASLEALGFRRLPPSGKSFVILTGPRFKR